MDKIDGHIRKSDKNKYLGFFNFDRKYEIIFNRIRYLIMLQSNTSDIYFYRYAKSKIDSDDLP